MILSKCYFVRCRSVKANITMLARANFCAEPHDVSLLWALWDMKSAGGMANMNSCGDGTQVLLLLLFFFALGRPN